MKNILFKILFILICSSIKLFSIENDTDSNKVKKCYNYIISSGLGMPIVLNHLDWNNRFTDGVILFLGWEFNLNNHHTCAIAINAHSWLFKKIENNSNSTINYKKLSGDLYCRSSIMPSIKFYTAKADSYLRLAFGLGFVLITSDRDYVGLGISGELHYKLNPNYSLSLETALNIGKLDLLNGGNREGVPCWINLKLNYILR